MKPAGFDYVRAESLEHALSALADGGGDAKPLAGGQSLVPALNMRIVRPTLLVDLNRAGLDGIETTPHALRVGATVRQATLEHDERAHPLLRDALPHVGHFVTRNRGTIGGSIAHADGAAELPLCLVALGGTVTADGPGGRREITADDFFVTHYSTTLQPAELVIETAWPTPAAHEGSAFEESALRAGDYGLSMVAVVLRREDGAARAVRVAVGAVSERPLLLATAADELEGRPIGEREARAAGAAAASALEPLDSIHASSGYLRSITATLVARAALRAWEAAA
jgi:CO/xanthine dehydrogenase FAD-binding subunit